MQKAYNFINIAVVANYYCEKYLLNLWRRQLNAAALYTRLISYREIELQWLLTSIYAVM